MCTFYQTLGPQRPVVLGPLKIVGLHMQFKGPGTLVPQYQGVSP